MAQLNVIQPGQILDTAENHHYLLFSPTILLFSVHLTRQTRQQN